MDPSAAPDNPAFTKALNQAIHALSLLYKECHKAYPDSPACEEILSMQRQVSEIERLADQSVNEDPMTDPYDPEQDMAEQGATAPAMAGPEMAGPPPGSLHDAAAQTRQMLLDAAARRGAA